MFLKASAHIQCHVSVKTTPLKILSTTAVLNVCATVVFVSFDLILVQSQTPFCEFREEQITVLVLAPDCRPC